jgi:rhodanese-related sulfurtransferase
MGFPNAVVLAGGLESWNQSGGAVASGHPAAVPWGLQAARRHVATVAPGPLGDALVLNVDTSDVYARGHVPGAAWICRSRLELELDGIAPDKARPIVLTCADGAQSTLAAITLAGIGYSAVRVLAGGTGAWVEAGLRVEGGLTRLVGRADDVVLKPYEKGRPSMEAYLRWEEELDYEGRSPHELLPAGD